MNLLNFQLVTPERTLLSQELVSLTCPTPMGQITILPGHVPLVSSLSPGELHAKTEKDDFYVYVSGGFVEVKTGSDVIVLADSAEHHYEINMDIALEARKRAEAAMKEHVRSDEEYAKVAAALERSLARINVARKHSNRRQPITSEGTFNE